MDDSETVWKESSWPNRVQQFFLFSPVDDGSRWTSLITVLQFTYDLCGWELGWWSWVRTLEHEILFSRLSQALLRREIFFEEVFGPHTFEIINLIYFLHHYTTIHWSQFTTRLTLIVMISLLISASPYAVRAQLLHTSDGVMLPEPSVSRSFSHFPCCSKSRECSGSLFTWLVGWVTVTPRRLS
jgi:hypothetical protein